MSEEPIATIGVVPVYQTELDRLLRACGYDKVAIVHGSVRAGKTAELIHQLQMTSVYDHAYWEAKLHSAVLSAMMNAYIDTGEVVVGGSRPSDKMAAPYFRDVEGHLRTYRGSPGETVTDNMILPVVAKPIDVRSQPDYLRHDPTKQVHRRRARKAYGRKGDRP